jgi:hypothetical protein
MKPNHCVASPPPHHRNNAGLAEQADTDTAFIARMTGVAEGDVLLQSRETRPFCPGFMLVADRRTRSLVLAFRGTVSGADLITDLTAAAVPVPPQLVHLYACHVPRHPTHSHLFPHRKESHSYGRRLRRLAYWFSFGIHAITLLHLLGRRHRRYTALSAWRMKGFEW